jgi:hypothetical protein
MDARERENLIVRYAAGPAEVAAVLDGITSAELDARPAPGEWSVREVIHHLADSEMEGALRLRRLLAEHRPALAGYDQEAFARRLWYDNRPITAALAAITAARETTVEILRRLTPEDWQREGTHSEFGRFTVEDWLRLYAAHAHEHAAQIRRARSVMAHD